VSKKKFNEVVRMLYTQIKEKNTVKISEVPEFIQ